MAYDRDGRPDPLGGQQTGHERHLHCDAPAPAAAAAAGGGSRVIGLYYPEWRVYAGRPPSKLRADLATHVYYAFVVPRPDGSLAYADRWAAGDYECDGTFGCVNAVRGLKEKKEKGRLKLVLSVGGGGKGSESFGVFAGTERGRIRFARGVREWIDRWEMDGVDGKEPSQNFFSLSCLWLG